MRKFLSSTFFWFVLGFGSFCASAWLAGSADVAESAPKLRLRSYGAIRSDFRLDSGQQRYQRIREQDGLVHAEYGFVTFDGDTLHLNFSIPADELAGYRREYGYTPEDLGALAEWQKASLAQAYQDAVKQRHSQQQLNRAAEEIRAIYREKQSSLLRARGFKFVAEDLLVPDITGIAMRNAKAVQPLALGLRHITDRPGYDSGAVVGAALALVQTAILYDRVPLEIEGRVIGGLYPPLQTLAGGKGDCDSKTALLAAILLNWNQIRMVGVGIPDHYLLGVLGQPGKGEIFIEYEGAPYVLMEPAGPAWLPAGTVAPGTLDLLNANSRLEIEPITFN